MPTTIENISLSGFRAYLQEQNISLAEGARAKSLAIFAPNAKGKSSLIDAVEFFFSTDGTIARLGQRRTSLQAGREALTHIEATKAGIESAVAISFQGSKGTFGGRRLVTDSTQVRPESADKILTDTKVDFIIRGSRLRHFVEQQTPSERYAEVSGWFGLSSLVEIQNNLRSTRLKLKQIIETNAAIKERLNDLKQATSNTILQWTDSTILTWVNDNFITPLDQDFSLKSFDINDLSYISLKNNKEMEAKQIGPAQLKLALTALKQTYELNTHSKLESGSISEVETAANKLDAALIAETQEKTKSANSLFKDIWEAAQPLLKADQPVLTNCPVCDTPFMETTPGSREKVAFHIETQLKTLEAYRKAIEALGIAKDELLKKVGSTKTTLVGLVASLDAIGYTDKTKAIKNFKEALEIWEDGQKLPDAASAKANILELITDMEEGKKNKEREGDHTWDNALKKVDELIVIKTRLYHSELIRNELQALLSELSRQETFIASQMRQYCQKVINQLRTRVNEIFRSIHPQEEHAPEIKLELDPAGRRSELMLLFDFGPDRQGVAPSGYLSDAQVHTLALSLRLAAIEMFNKDVPVIVLDDVVTSYDADHRRAIAGLLADQFANHQVLIVTHDERFFHYLKEQLPSTTWEFKRIIKLDPSFGPRFHGHNVPDVVIEALHASDENAANEMRQAEEEWLIQTCRDFGVDIRIREVHKSYSYERAELAEALMRFLQSRGFQQPPVPGVANRFLSTLQSGQVENFGSHFQDNPQGSASVGDEITRWKEFKEFRDSFRCHACQGNRFKRPISLKKPVCRKDNCETPFAFSVGSQN